MRLDQSTWLEVQEYLRKHDGIFLPVGSTEQHGPMGLIGTDAFCAAMIAQEAADEIGAYVAPALAYTPAPFNTHFPGTVSLSEPVFEAMFSEIVVGLRAQGFGHVYVLNAHGANLAPMQRAMQNLNGVRIRSWWSFDSVNALRRELFGAWEGMHATPAEISITQTAYRNLSSDLAGTPPRQLDAAEMAARAGDNHGAPDLHRREFPDGRVGSHSALASPEYGRRLLRVASQAIATDFRDFLAEDEIDQRIP